MARRHPVRRSLVRVRCLRQLLLGALLSLSSSFSAAQPPRQVVLLGPLPDNGLVDARALNNWLERWFAPRLAEKGGSAPGAVVAVVQEGRVLLARGFGYADLSSRALARANTVMRVGALSKPVTAAAVMLLVEDGLLDVRRPVSDYVRDVPVNAALGRPVTVLDLVTHTAGFDARLPGDAARAGQEATPLRDIVRLAMPPQIRAPGQALAYSDHGYALLGHLVESVSGRAFDDYVDARIFRPLGMIRSGFGESPALVRLAAAGYEGTAGHYTPAARTPSPIHPAAGLMTTADDMAAFLVALLGSRRDGEGTILGARSLAEMHRRQFEVGKSAPGVAFGLFEYPTGSERALVHGGSTGGFRSVIALWPDRRMGLFVSDNGSDDAIARDLVDAFARKYLEHGPVAIGTAENAVAGLAGAYRAVSQPRATAEKVAALSTGDMEVEAWYFGRLRVGAARFEKIGPGAFRNVWGRGRFWFVERGPGASPTLVTTDPLEGVVAWERQPWYGASSMHRQVLWACFALFVSIPFIRWRPHGESERAWQGRGTELVGQVARTLLWVVGGLDLLLVLSIVLSLGAGSEPMLLAWPPAVMRWALRANLAAASIALALPACAWLAWRRRCWTRRAVGQYAACAAGALVFAAWSWYWNLLGL